MNSEEFRVLIESGQLQDLRPVLESDPDLVNRTITWFLNQENRSDPLHYLCGSVFNDELDEGVAAEIAALLLEFGALIEGSEGRESPLVGATSLGVEKVATLLIESGANVEAASVFGARPLHWAAFIGLPHAVATLIQHGAKLDAKCTEYGATPLYWAVRAMGPHGPRKPRDPVGAAKLLVEAGANVHTANKRGRTLLEFAEETGSGEMQELLRTIVI